MSRTAPQSRRGVPGWLGLLGWVLLTTATGAVGAVASVNAGEFYTRLIRPGWAPPAWLFGPAWTTLYLLMAVAAWLVWRTPEPVGGIRRQGLGLFVLQLVLNGAWSWLFFRWHLGGWAMADLVALWLVVLATLIRFGQVRPLSGWLLLPYLLWLSYAGALNWAVWQANPGLL